MSCFNRLYSLGYGQKVDSHSRIELVPADSSCNAKAVRWGKWLAKLPVKIPHTLHSLYLLIKHQEMIEPIRAQMVPGRNIHLLPSPAGTIHVITSSLLANQVLQNYRSDKEGLFELTEKGENSRLFLPLLSDITGQKAGLEDFLFTCQPAQAERYRNIILNFFGPKDLGKIRERLDRIVANALLYLKGQEKEGVIRCQAKELTGMFTVAVVSNILLGKEVNDFAEYQEIGKAITICLDYAIMKLLFRKPTEAQEKDYKTALVKLRETIDHSQGSFTDALNQTELTEVQKKGVLFLMFIAGGETSSNLLEMSLGQLGRNPHVQTKLRSTSDNLQDNQELQAFIYESLRYHPPVLIGRVARTDIDLKVANPDGSSWNYLFPKGETVLFSSYFAARDPESCLDPNDFNLERLQKSNPRDLNIFGRGKHLCPGQWLALAETGKFLMAILNAYEIESDLPKNPRPRALTTISLEPGVNLTLKRRM